MYEAGRYGLLVGADMLGRPIRATSKAGDKDFIKYSDDRLGFGYSATHEVGKNESADIARNATTRVVA